MSSRATRRRPCFSTKRLAGAVAAAGTVAGFGILADEAQATLTSYWNACAHPTVNHGGGYGGFNQPLHNSVNVAGYLCSGTGRPYACTAFSESNANETKFNGPYCNPASSHAMVSTVPASRSSRYKPYARVCGACGGHTFTKEQFLNGKASH